MYVIYVSFYFSVFRAVTVFCGHNCTDTSKSTTENNCLNSLVISHWCTDLQFLKDFIFWLGFKYKWPYMMMYYRNLTGDGVFFYDQTEWGKRVSGVLLLAHWMCQALLGRKRSGRECCVPFAGDFSAWLCGHEVSRTTEPRPNW